MNLVDSKRMTQIIFRELPGVATVERQLDLQFRDRLLDDEVEELPHLIDDISVRLFGITHRDTFYWALPTPLRGEYRRAEWEANFDILGQYSRDRNNRYWRRFLISILDANKETDCIASRCLDGSSFARFTASIPKR